MGRARRRVLAHRAPQRDGPHRDRLRGGRSPRMSSEPEKGSQPGGVESLNDEPSTQSKEHPVSPVTVYWRPMCGYCTTLKHELDRHGLEYAEIDIWEQRDQAEVVRAATGGDEI